jgi:hypothetical protein
VPNKYESSSSKNRISSNAPQKQTDDFLEKGSDDFKLISITYRNHLPKYNCTSSVFRKITVPPLRAQTIYVYFAETGFSRRTDFTVIRYSRTKSGVPSKNRFRFQGNIVWARRMWGSMYIVLAQIYLICLQFCERFWLNLVCATYLMLVLYQLFMYTYTVCYLVCVLFASICFKAHVTQLKYILECSAQLLP